MTSPFVRRQRLATELRTLREQNGMTADRLACLIHQSRMKISKLENAHIRPDLAEVMKILDVLGVTGDKWHEIVRIARDAAERGWWDSYGNAMGARQRMFADIESGAEAIRGYYQFAIPGILQTPKFTKALVDLDQRQASLTYRPDAMIDARLQRRRIAFDVAGPVCDFILDEFIIRRLAVPADVMRDQLSDLIETASAAPRLSLRVLPVDARVEGGFLARSTFMIYTFPDPGDPPMAIADTVNADIIHTESADVGRYSELYERLRKASASPVRSLTLLEEAVDRLSRLGESSA